jgi:hypothetical protein
LRWR